MKNVIPKPIVMIALAFLWCFYQVIQIILAGLLSMAAILFYNWLFPAKLPAYYTPRNDLMGIIESVGWTKYILTVVIIFVAMKVIQWQANREEDLQMSIVEADAETGLQAVFGESASMSPDGLGYLSKITRGGTEFEARHQVSRMKMRGIEISTGSVTITFQIADKGLEMRIAQKAFWFSPSMEPLTIVPGDQSNLLETLAHRYDCYCPDRQKISEFISDGDVQRELLPKFPNPRERSTLTVKNGEVTVECVSETKYERSVGAAAAFELTRKLLRRAEIFDRRLREMEKGRH